MGIDLSRFKVIYGDKVLNALALDQIVYAENSYPGINKPGTTIVKPEFLIVHAINEDGNIITICDEAWRFQFLPIVNKGG